MKGSIANRGEELPLDSYQDEKNKGLLFEDPD
jgi:hypothetical protein